MASQPPKYRQVDGELVELTPEEIADWHARKQAHAEKKAVQQAEPPRESLEKRLERLEAMLVP